MRSWWFPRLEFSEETLQLAADISERERTQAKERDREVWTFSYVARDEDGQIVRGQVEAWSHKAALKILWSRKFTVIECSGVERQKRKHVPRDEALVVFTSKLACLVEAGVPLARCLKLLHHEAQDPKMRRALEAVYLDVTKGRSLHAAMAPHVHVFSGNYVGTIEAGYRGGGLPWALRQLSTTLEAEMQLRRRIRSATIYPLIVVAIGTVITLAMAIFIMPTFADMFRNANVALPFVTRAMFAITDTLVNPWFLGGCAASALCMRALFRRAMLTSVGRQLFDLVRMFTPIMGPLHRKYLFMQVFGLMAILTRAGLPFAEQFLLLARTSDSIVVRRLFIDIFVRIRDGADMPEAFSAHDEFFGHIQLGMIGVGHSSGEFTRCFEFISRMYRQEIDSAIDLAVTTIEPVLVGLIGLLVTFVVMALFLPIYSCLSALL